MSNPFPAGTGEHDAWEDAERTDAALRTLAWDDDVERPATLGTRASKVTTRRVRWAWKGRIPFGKLSSVEGDPGDGKSLMTLDLAARWSSGRPMPDGFALDGPVHVILISAEDDEADTIAPRLVVAGAVLDNVTLITSGATDDIPFTLGVDLSTLERTIVETGARIVVLDPLSAFLSSDVDSHNDLSVRRALWPLKSLARRTGCAIIVVRHLNKGGTGIKAIYRGNGSIAFIGAFRCGFAVARDPDDEPDGRLLAAVKSNISRLAPTLCWRVESTPDGEVPYIAWGGVSGLTAQQALDGPRRPSSVDDAAEQARVVRQYERDFLLDVLAAGPLSWAEIAKLGKVDGFTEHSLRRARADAGLIKLIGVDGNAGVRWARPSTSDVQIAREDGPLDHLPTHVGTKTAHRNTRASGQVPDGPPSEMDRRRAIDSADGLCYACDSRDVTRYYGPWWTIACRAHRPSMNGGEP